MHSARTAPVAERGHLDGLRAPADVGYPGADFYQPQFLVKPKLL